MSDLYLSPIFASRAESTHGYDIVDYNRIDPKLGGRRGFELLSNEARRLGMGMILDIVPNHMGVGKENGWWNDVLEYGPFSKFSRYFDIDWKSKKVGEDRVLCPFLNGDQGSALRRRELRLVYGGGSFALEYNQEIFPLAAATYDTFLEGLVLPETLTRKVEGVSLLCRRMPLPGRTSQSHNIYALSRKIKGSIERLYAGESAFRRSLDALTSRCNSPQGERVLLEVLDRQFYRLSDWRLAARLVNYRRFLNINDMVGVREEDPDVFDSVHSLLFRLVREGRVSGLRVDHPAGLLNPERYLERLDGRCKSSTKRREALFVVLESVLVRGESLPKGWEAAGTTGYEFLNELNGIYVHGGNESRVRKTYSEFVGSRVRFRGVVYGSKLKAIETMKSELEKLVALSLSLARAQKRRFTEEDMREALRTVVACFPVYRTNVSFDRRMVSRSDRRQIEAAVGRARSLGGAPRAALAFVADLVEMQAATPTRAKQDLLEFIGRFQQFTASVMVKGYEDTALYLYNPLLSLNEVGGDPGSFGVSLERFHAANVERTRRRPHSMLTTSTHDTKRSEDVRARLNVLSEIPDEWERALAEWGEMNGPLKMRVKGRGAPDPNEEYSFYQTLLGAWPLGAMTSPQHSVFVERMAGWMKKATKEGKKNTSWVTPDQEYDTAVEAFVRAALDTKRNGRFLRSFSAFHSRVARLGMFNSLSQLLVKLTAPGVPDTYQGNEVWDFSLVDPDNRRPVDYARLKESLKRLDADDRLGLSRALLSKMEDGRVKQYVLRTALKAREQDAGLFSSGEYRALEVVGKERDRVIAFARVSHGRSAVVVAPRFAARILEGDYRPEAWGTTGVVLDWGEPFENAFTGEQVTPVARRGRYRLRIRDVLQSFPVALLLSCEGS